MNKQDYLNRLEKLLADIPAEDRTDALTFYENYFEDAGVENEDAVIKELGTPERIAASIKRDLTELTNENRGTASAEQASRYDKPNYSSYQTDYNANNTQTYSNNSESTNSFFGRIKKQLNDWTFYRENKTLCIVLFIVALVLTSPAWGSVLGGIVGLVFGIMGLVVGTICFCFTLALVGLVGGFAMIVLGITCLAASLGTGLFIIGLGILFLAFGLLFTLATGGLCFRFIPWIYRSIRNLISNQNKTVGGATA